LTAYHIIPTTPSPLPTSDSTALPQNLHIPRPIRYHNRSPPIRATATKSRDISPLRPISSQRSTDVARLPRRQDMLDGIASCIRRQDYVVGIEAQE
jgi:hypothetical protein